MVSLSLRPAGARASLSQPASPRAAEGSEARPTRSAPPSPRGPGALPGLTHELPDACFYEAHRARRLFSNPWVLPNGQSLEGPPYIDGPSGQAAIPPPPGAVPNHALKGIIDTAASGGDWRDVVDTFSMADFVDPVVTPDGHTYSRASISQWLRGHLTSPNTNRPLGQPGETLVLRPNRALSSVLHAISGREDAVGEPSEVTLELPARQAPAGTPIALRLGAPPAMQAPSLQNMGLTRLSRDDLGRVRHTAMHAANAGSALGGGTWLAFTAPAVVNAAVAGHCTTTGFMCLLSPVAAAVNGLATAGAVYVGASFYQHLRAIIDFRPASAAPSGEPR